VVEAAVVLVVVVAIVVVVTVVLVVEVVSGHVSKQASEALPGKKHTVPVGHGAPVQLREHRVSAAPLTHARLGPQNRLPSLAHRHVPHPSPHGAPHAMPPLAHVGAVVVVVLLVVVVVVLVEVELVVELLVVVVVEVVVVVQSEKQQVHDMETVPPICVHAVAAFAAFAAFTVVQFGGFANWQVTLLVVPHDDAASQLSSSDLHADVIVLSLWATQLWKPPTLFWVQVPSPPQHFDWIVLLREHRWGRQAAVSPLNVPSREIIGHEHTSSPSWRHWRRTCFLHA
jgi:hypothetical protein